MPLWKLERLQFAIVAGARSSLSSLCNRKKIKLQIKLVVKIKMNMHRTVDKLAIGAENVLFSADGWFDFGEIFATDPRPANNPVQNLQMNWARFNRNWVRPSMHFLMAWLETGRT